MNELVSIAVITYNSSKYVLETLESAKAQTYENIELIVSDDCSTDNTIELCREWLEKNGERFVRSEIVVTDVNTGISANCNRALAVSNGKWIKVIAGDDVLFSNCISDCVKYMLEHDGCKILFGRKLSFYNELRSENLCYERHPFIYCWESKLTANDQYHILKKLNFVPAPASFMDRKVLCQLGGFDEKYPLLEDFPLWLKYTSQGFKLYLLDEYIVYYRIHRQSVSYNKTGRLLDVEAVELRNRVVDDLIRCNMSFLEYNKMMVERWLEMQIIKKGNVSTSFYSLFYYRIYKFCCRTYNIYFKMKDIIRF